MSENTLTLGTRVTFTHPLYRHTHAGNPLRKAWEPHPFYADAAKSREGIIVGKRTLANGHLRMEEWGTELDADEYFTAYLVAFNLHRKPVYVRPEHVHPTLPEGATNTAQEPTP